VQNSIPSRNPVSSPSLLQTLLEHTFLGARPASPGAAPNSGDIGDADPAPGADPAVGDVDAESESDATDTADMDTVGRLELAELLGVLRDSIEWVFTLAERRAQGDPIDITAIHRVRDAVLHRVNAVIIGAPDTESPRMRSADLWTVAESLIDALDPSLVARAAGVGTSLADALAAGLPFDPSLVVDPGAAAAPIPGPHVRPPVPPSWCVGAIPSRPIALFLVRRGVAAVPRAMRRVMRGPVPRLARSGAHAAADRAAVVVVAALRSLLTL